MMGTSANIQERSRFDASEGKIGRVNLPRRIIVVSVSRQGGILHSEELFRLEYRVLTRSQSKCLSVNQN